VKVPADQALKVAHLSALKKAVEKTTDPDLKGQLQRLIDDMQKEVSELPKK
jgi:hypothetical protein